MSEQIAVNAHEIISRELGDSIQSRMMSYGYWGECTSYRRAPMFSAMRNNVAIVHNTYECSSKGTGVEMLILVVEDDNGKCRATILYESTPEENIHIALNDMKVQKAVAGYYIEYTFSSGGPVGGQPWRKTEKIRFI